MATITIEVPDELSGQLEQIRDQLPELLRLCLTPTAISAQVYRYVLDFVASQPTPQEIAEFRPTEEMQKRLMYLLGRSQSEELTLLEQAELDEYERIEHFIVLLKAGNLAYLTQANQS
jgi:hypothetical protein